jgi:hypothetical protein
MAYWAYIQITKNASLWKDPKPTSIILPGPMTNLKLNLEMFDVSGFTTSINLDIYWRQS